MAMVFDRMTVEELVGETADPRFWRGGLGSRGGSGRTKYDWFTCSSAHARVEEVLSAAAPSWTWPSVLQVKVPKEVELPAYVQFLLAEVVRTSGSSATKDRPIGMSDPLGQAIQYLLYDALLPYVEERLTRVALAYRPGLSMVTAIKTAINYARENKLWVVSVVDAEDCYGSMRWQILDNLVDKLNLDDNVKRLVKSSYRVEIVDEDGNEVRRLGRGVPQGMVLGPLLANLYFSTFDKRVQSKLGHLGVRVYRFCDDIIIFGPNRQAVAEALAIVREELQRIGFAIKKGTGKLTCLKDNKNLPTWLGITFSKDESWASKDKLVKKAKSLLLLRERGLLGDEDLEVRLWDLRRYYEGLLHPRRAAEAAGWISDLVTPHCPSPRKEGIDNINKQIRFVGMQNKPGASATAQASGLPVHPADRDQEVDLQSSHTSATPTPSRATAGDGPRPLADSPGHKEMEVVR